MSDHLAAAISARGELVLRERPGEPAGVLELRANGVFVMDTAETSTERALASHALALHQAPRRVLVGGLGLGFTTKEVLADPRVTHCEVVEIEAALVEWMQQGVIGHGPALLADPRLHVSVADVSDVLTAAAADAFDLILLDVDNGPGYLVHDANAALYEESWLAIAGRALAPGGVLVVWSAAAAPTLEHHLKAAIGNAEALPIAVDLQGRAEHYWLYVARAMRH